MGGLARRHWCCRDHAGRPGHPDCHCHRDAHHWDDHQGHPGAQGHRDDHQGHPGHQDVARRGRQCAQGHRRFVGRRFVHRRRHLGRPLDARQCRAEDVVWLRQSNAALETMKMNFEVEKEYSDLA